MTTKGTLIFVIAAASFSSTAFGQTVYEASDGSSSLLISHAGQASINFAEKSAKVSLVRAVSAPSFRWGGALKVLMSEGSATLFESESDQRLPGGEASAFLGYYWIPANDIIAFNGVAVLVTGKRASHGLADTLTVSVADTLFQGVSAQALYNAILGLGRFADVAAGVALGVGRSNNYTELAKIDLCTLVAESDGSRISRCSEKRIGEYRELTAGIGAVDVLIYPRFLASRLGFSGYLRYNGARETELRPGVGLFVAAAGQPLKMLGGAALEWTGDTRRIVLHLGLPL